MEKIRWQAISLALEGKTMDEIAQATLPSKRWVYMVLKRFNPLGPEGLADYRHRNPGQRPKHTPEEQVRVLRALQGSPPDGGLWTGPKLRDWVERELGNGLYSAHPRAPASA
nr:helix-turn-helix domain-containing protein [Thermus tenuipuniceus]